MDSFSQAVPRFDQLPASTTLRRLTSGNLPEIYRPHFMDCGQWIFCLFLEVNSYQMCGAL